MDVDRERVARTPTFWPRPQFVLPVFSRFQKVAGFDRAIALASGALTATIPLAIVTSAIASQLVFLLVLAVLSLTRGMQRLFEQTWELKPLSVRDTASGLLWIGGSRSSSPRAASSTPR